MKKFKLTSQQRESAERRRARQKEMRASFHRLSEIERRAYIAPVTANPTEFEIQAFLYGALLQMGYPVRGEVKTRCGSCVFDLVVYDSGGAPVRVIEVKKHHGGAFGGKRGRKREGKMRAGQMHKYSKFGVPVEMIQGLREAREYIERVKCEGIVPPVPPPAQGQPVNEPDRIA